MMRFYRERKNLSKQFELRVESLWQEFSLILISQWNYHCDIWKVSDWTFWACYSLFILFYRTGHACDCAAPQPRTAAPPGAEPAPRKAQHPFLVWTRSRRPHVALKPTVGLRLLSDYHSSPVRKVSLRDTGQGHQRPNYFPPPSPLTSLNERLTTGERLDAWSGC